MKRMKNWLCSLILCCVVLCAFPLTAFALTDTEPNDTIVASQTAVLGETITGSISTTSDTDVYKVVMNESGKLTLNMTSYIEYYSIYLYDETGTELWHQEGNHWNETVGFRNDSYSFHLKNGTYYVSVNGMYNDKVGIYDHFYYYTGDYILTPSVVSANATETEPNNSIAESNTLGLNTSAAGQIAMNDISDFYKLTLKNPGRVKLDFTSYINYYSLFLYDAEGTEVWVDKSNEWNATIGSRSDSYNIDLMAGTYYLKVTGENHYNVGIYKHCDRYTGNYSMKTAFTKVVTNETEPNNSIAEADVYSQYGTITSQIACNDRFDFHSFTLTKDRTLKLDVTSYMQHYSIYLYNSDGTEVYWSNKNVWDAAKGFRKDTHKIDLPADTYYLKVTGYYQGTESPSTGTYEIVLNYIAPPVVKASNVASSGKIKLTWDAVEDAVSYKVYRATSKNGTYSLVKTATGTSYTNTSAVAGKAYYYKVVAVDAYGGTSAASAVVSRTCDLPQPVVTTSNVASSGKIKLTWDKVSGASGYKIYRATSKSGTYSLLKTITSGSTTSFTNTGAKAGTTYYYKVIATHTTTAANSAYSTIVSRTCDLAQPVVSLSNVASTGKIRLTWDKVDGAVSYKVYRSTTGKTGSWSLIKTTTGTSFTNTSAKAGTKYYYKVIAIAEKSAANSAYSAAKNRTCDLAQPVVTITRNSSGNPKLTWKAVSGAVEYRVYRATSKTGTYSLMKTTTSTTYTNTSAKAGTTYYYKVMAVHSKSAANSAYSSVASIQAK